MHDVLARLPRVGVTPRATVSKGVTKGVTRHNVRVNQASLPSCLHTIRLLHLTSYNSVWFHISSRNTAAKGKQKSRAPTSTKALSHQRADKTLPSTEEAPWAGWCVFCCP